VQGGLNLTAYFIGAYMVEYNGFDNSKSAGDFDVPLAYAFVTIISLICIVAAIFRRSVITACRWLSLMSPCHILSVSCHRLSRCYHSVYTNVYNVATFIDEGQTPVSQTVFASHDYTLMEESSIKIQQEGFARMLMVTSPLLLGRKSVQVSSWHCRGKCTSSRHVSQKRRKT
jgi:hypothetical protein